MDEIERRQLRARHLCLIERVHEAGRSEQEARGRLVRAERETRRAVEAARTCFADVLAQIQEPVDPAAEGA